MTESVSPTAEAVAAPAPAALAAETPTAARPPQNGRNRRESPGGGVRRRGAPNARVGTGAERRPPPPQHPVLATLATLAPALFGAKPLPMKRGILQELLTAFPDALNKETLKEALAQYTRSTRYLTVMASGEARHGLDGQPVEPVAPEHQHHALLEVFKRRHARTGADLRAELRSRMVQAAEASGLAPLDYAERVRTKDEAANALLDAAMAELAERAARDQALLQAFEAAGQSVNDFADSYGLHPIEVAATLNRARARA